MYLKSITFIVTLLLHYSVFSVNLDTLYNSLIFDQHSKPNSDVFKYGIRGYQKVKDSIDFVTDPYLTIIDYRLPSIQKRLWIIDVNNNKIIDNTLVAHGKNSGENMARKFSNKQKSYQSSLGFYISEGLYVGKHDKSLILKGLEKNSIKN